MPYPKRTVRAVRLLPLLLCATTLTMACPLPAQALAKPLQTSSQSIQQAHVATPNSQSSLYTFRLALYRSVEALTGIPWYRLAAIDQYERTLTIAHPKDRKHAERVTGIFVTAPVWSGLMNPDPEDRHPRSISFFSGLGQDGSGDGIANRDDDRDLLFSIASYLGKYGSTEDEFSIAVWEYYHNSRAVQRVQQFAKLYRTYGKLELGKQAFPLPLGSIYSYRSTWGSRRSWGGYRIHEGTDLFAGYGVPVRSTCYGVVEMKGWNPFGGWRIGIRDLSNRYHYYAHLSGFDKTVHNGDIVKPGQIVGWVGSSGYGKPGTQGKFPPHLHYGIYRDNGWMDWSFDPYPLLRQWEQTERKALKTSKVKGTST
ncbi:hypothetical protein ABH892_002635 [Paenibacillus sp. RC254]|uniref:M23 family metallopeptidase n=1 Tax=unclassified Paenibacillus TaxID=185978 RepID=UPI0024B8B54C|nr:M23 family metallopeptidase [Paenibacillus sp. RC334]